VRLKVPEGKGASQLDLLGAVLLSACLVALVWGLAHGNPLGWSHRDVLAALGAGVVLGCAFIAAQRRNAQHAMVPARLFRSPVFAAGLLAALLLSGALLGTLFFMAQFFQVTRGASPLEAGASMLPWTATLFVVAPIAGSMVRRVGERRLVVIGLGLQAVGMLWLAYLARAESAYILWVLPLAMAGAGISMAMPAAQSAVLGAVEPIDIGKASGLFNTLRQLGGVMGVAITVAVFLRSGGYGSAREFSMGFAAALVAAAAMSLAGALVGLRLPGRALGR
jgi:predicted MFS family arabinose efflux permease